MSLGSLSCSPLVSNHGKVGQVEEDEEDRRTDGDGESCCCDSDCQDNDEECKSQKSCDCHSLTGGSDSRNE